MSIPLLIQYSSLGVLRVATNESQKERSQQNTSICVPNTKWVPRRFFMPLQLRCGFGDLITYIFVQFRYICLNVYLRSTRNVMTQEVKKLCRNQSAPNQKGIVFPSMQCLIVVQFAAIPSFPVSLLEPGIRMKHCYNT
eukprot:gb/GECG01002727.1/.p1 GENE.gb/GECG01002727.1/~~gb/GECG01002727.1/.p1  ORF type:complete len:138 (+),score=6.90 gb/GECG01002727.1/:1-414(+)